MESLQTKIGAVDAEKEKLDKQNLELQKEVAKLSLELGNLSIKHDLQVSHLQTKTKLLEDALTNRNQDIELAEDNN